MAADVFGLNDRKRQMIIVKLMGGLGNQMFQYAAGKALALTHNTDLRFDLSWFDTITKSDTVRTYNLTCFSFPDTIFASPKDLQSNKAIFLPSRIKKLIKRLYPSFQKNVILEKYFHYDPSLLDSPSNAYIEGYWQSFRYFEPFSNIIREELRFQTPMDAENQKLSESILATPSVSLHIRRGDYVTNTHANDFHGTTSLEYYDSAIKAIYKHITEPHFFIFSDDIEWTTQNLSIPFNATYINHNHGNMAFEDMRLMSLCKHNIIANSTFSWWGAWLNTNPNKIVIAPKTWFQDNTINTNDLIPGSWLRV